MSASVGACSSTAPSTSEKFNDSQRDGWVRAVEAFELFSFVLARSSARSFKETAMRVRKLRGVMKVLFRIDNRIGRGKRNFHRSLRPIHHKLQIRIEAHIFTEFIALCLQATLKAIARAHAPGLTPRQIIGKALTIKMIDVVMPTTDWRLITMPRHVEPLEDVRLVLEQLGFDLPPQPPLRISAAPAL